MPDKRLFIQQNRKLSILQIAGAVLLLLGVGLLIFVAFYEFSLPKAPPDTGQSADQASTLAAVGFFLIMIGMALLFPDMLKSNKDDGTSTMRVAVFMIISVFVILCVKIYWNCSVAAFKLDSTWAYVIMAALGSKAVQSLGENNAFTGNRNGPPTQPGNPLFDNGQPLSPDAPVHDSNNLTAPPITPPASITPKAN